VNIRALALGLVVIVIAVAATVIVLNSGPSTPSAGPLPGVSPRPAPATGPGGLKAQQTTSVPDATQLTAGCGAVPHTCGFPDATNTGVPAGMALKTVPGQVSSGPGWHFNRHGWVQVDGNGAALSGLYIPYNINVTAANVTIKDVRVAVGGNKLGISLRHTKNVTIEDSDIYGPSPGPDRLATGIKDVFGNSAGIKILRDDIWHFKTGVQLESGLISDSYIHNPGFRSGDHINGITSNGGHTAQLTIQHNTILVGHSQTDAIGLFEGFGIQANRLVKDNLLAGGGYTIYAGQMAGRAKTYNIRIINNKISQVYYPNGGYYGDADLFNPKGSGNLWSGNTFSGNRWDETDSVIAGP
jgi:hypothetical protein